LIGVGEGLTQLSKEMNLKIPGIWNLGKLFTELTLSASAL
jgi:hypothetical protein